MHGKVLIIDPIATHRIVLRVKLAASQYDVLQAASILEAMQLIARVTPDLILTATNLPDGEPKRLISQLRAAGVMGKVPVIALGDGNNSVERMALLRLGFDDVMPRPLNNNLLMARARSLLRGYSSASEWQLREGTSRALGFAEPGTQFGPASRVRLVASHPEFYTHLQRSVARSLETEMTLTKAGDVIPSDEDARTPDAFVLVSTPEEGPDTLDFLASLRCHKATRHAVVLVVQEGGTVPLGAQMLDTGANDLVPCGATPDEIALRLSGLLQRKRLTDALRDTIRSGAEAAVIDPLTGLHNRRYAMPHVARIAERAMQSGKPFALMIADMDHFKRINDEYGHAAGDAVLIEVADRLRNNLRAVDLVARIGGEEFLIVLPGVGLQDAQKAAQRLCHKVSAQPIILPTDGHALSATLSIGMIVCDVESGVTPGQPLTAEGLLDRADQALYDAKADGRNRVTLSRAAA